MESSKELTITEAAGRCAQKFVGATTLDSSSSQLKTSLHDQLGRFKIWAGNLGVFASSTASADYRLRDEPDLRDVFISMLNRLAERLVDIEQDLKHQFNHGIGPTEAQQSEGKQTNSSSSSSLGLSSEDECDNHQERLLIVDQEENDCLRQIRGLLDRLFRLSASIRKPVSLSENERIARFVARKEDPDEIRDFESYVRWQIQQWCPDTTVALIDRLTAAAVARKRRLWYRQNHRQKLTEGTQDWFSSKPGTPAKEPSKFFGVVETSKKDRKEHDSAPRTVKFAPTVTKASSIEKPTKLEYEKSIAPSNLTKSAIARRGLLDVPPPPIVEYGQETQCPYCPQVLKASQLKPAYWTYECTITTTQEMHLLTCTIDDMYSGT